MEIHHVFKKNRTLPEKTPPRCPLGKRGDFTAHSIFKAFCQDFLSEDVCRRWIMKALHSGQAVCPHCDQPLADAATERLFDNRQAYCRSCRRKFMGSTGTVLGSCKLSFKDLFFIGIAVCLGIRTGDIAKIVGCDVATARRWVEILAEKSPGKKEKTTHG